MANCSRSTNGIGPRLFGRNLNKLTLELRLVFSLQQLASAALLLLLISSAVGAQSSRLELRVENTEQLKSTADRIRKFDIDRFDSIFRLTGLATAGRPIRVVLVPEDSRIARDVTPWVAAFADEQNDLIVLFPGRIGSYPYDSLEVVLHHEVTHILMARAAGGGRLPRWFHEGLASTAERSWGLSSRSRFLWANVTSGEPNISELEGLFSGREKESTRAYTIAHAFVRDLLTRYGPSLVPQVLYGVASGATFDQAFFNVTGTTIGNAMRLFWNSAGGWEEWITFLASPFTLWTLITGLALVAILQHRRRRIERRLQWEEDERRETESWEEHRRKYRIH